MPDRRRSAVLAEVVRSGFVEGVHRGSLVVLDADGSVLLERGDVGAPMFPRSSNKLMQATGMVELGYPGGGELLALAAASHSGEPHHVDAVRRILTAAGLDDTALRTPADWPLGRQAWIDHVRAGGSPAPVLMNCSGKHAAMLATCVVHGWPLDDYRAPDHPLQVHLSTTIERLAGERIAATGTDGCGAPVAAVSLVGLARAFAGAVSAEPSAPERTVADAMRAHPEYVGGTDRDVTALMRAVPGLLVKDGAEGVYAAALPDGRALALKVDDGAERPRPLVAAAVLRMLGVDAPALDAFEILEVSGGGRRVGEVRVPSDLLR
ncbi:MAG TPA: asparaginase [Candidatus Angelobacter sp.]|nr:asparaginase [Candidatus Angelobacter sp.]